jgi:AcrR family transcriptional regulator
MTVLEDLERRPERAGEGEPGVDERAISALLACVGRFGLSKTTLDDVAREAGCSRATLYRYFDRKAALVRRAVNVELARLTARAVDAAGAQDTLEDATVALVTTAARDLVTHRALQFLLAHEPESILGQLAFGPGDRLLVRVGDEFAPAFDRWLDVADAQRAGDWIARVLRSYVLMPEPSIDLTDVAAARDLLRMLVVPALEPFRRNR